jgi:hypothetical protein
MISNGISQSSTFLILASWMLFFPISDSTGFMQLKMPSTQLICFSCMFPFPIFEGSPRLFAKSKLLFPFVSFDIFSSTRVTLKENVDDTPHNNRKINNSHLFFGLFSLPIMSFCSFSKTSCVGDPSCFSISMLDIFFFCLCF